MAGLGMIMLLIFSISTTCLSITGMLNTDRVTGIELAKLANPNITWETAEQG